MKNYTFKILILILISGLTYSCIPDDSSAIDGLPDSVVNNDPPGAPPRGFTEDFNDHNQEVRRQYFDSYTGVYYDSIVDRSITWPFTFFSNTWEKVTDTYGNFAGENLLYVVGHGDNREGLYTTTFDKDKSKSLIDFTVTADSTGVALDAPVALIAELVQNSANGAHNSPAQAVWQDKFTEIFTYDLYKSLELADSTRVKNKYLQEVADFPNADTYWFRDWFLPIYENYNGSATLGNFFRVLSQNFPIDGNDYARDMNLGEMVHFFSGATGADLEPLAESAFDWTDEYKNQLLRARAEFPNLNYPFEPASEIIDLTGDATITVSKDNGGGADANEGSLKLIDGDTNTKFLTDGFPMDVFWLQQNFTEAKVVNKYTLTSGNDAPDRDLKSWTISGSNDGVNFTLLDTRVDQSWNEERNKTREFNFDNETAYMYYRLDVQANNGSSLIQISEWRLLNLSLISYGPTDFTENATISVSRENGSGANGGEGSTKVIDNNIDTKFLVGGFPAAFWMQQNFTDAVIVNQYTFTSGNDAQDRDPVDWQLSGSNDETNWDVLDTRTDQSFPDRKQTRTFLIDNDQPYLYYRIDITKNNGSDAMQMSEWRLLGN